MKTQVLLYQPEVYWNIQIQASTSVHSVTPPLLATCYKRLPTSVTPLNFFSTMPIVAQKPLTWALLIIQANIKSPDHLGSMWGYLNGYLLSLK